MHLSKAAKHKRKTELKLTKQNAHPQIQTTTKPRRVLSVRQMWNAEINPEKQVPARGAEIVSPQLLAAGTASGRLISEPLHFYSATSSECLSCTNSCLVKKKKRKKSGFGGFEWKHFLPTPEATFSRTTQWCSYKISKHQIDATHGGLQRPFRLSWLPKPRRNMLPEGGGKGNPSVYFRNKGSRKLHCTFPRYWLAPSPLCTREKFPTCHCKGQSKTGVGVGWGCDAEDKQRMKGFLTLKSPHPEIRTC